MSKKNKIAITGALASIVAATMAEVTPTPEPTPPKTKTTGKKRIPMARVFSVDGSIALLSDSVDTVKGYVDGFNKLPIRPRAGYDNFWSKDDGFTNAEKYKTLTPQGVGKMMAVLQYQAARIIASGGDDATTMQSILDGLTEYTPVALEDAKHEHEQAALNIAFGELVAALDGNTDAARAKLADYAAENGLTLPLDTTVVADDNIEGDEAESADVEEPIEA